MERYLTGLLTDLPHKTADTIAAAVVGTSTELLQHSLNDATWDALALDEARVKRLLVIHPPKSGVLVFDDTGLPKKGTESVGVAAQYSGMLGKIGNCQVVVSAEYLCRLAPGLAAGPYTMGGRAVLRRCQAGMRPGRLPGATLGWAASTPGFGHVGV